ncbi:MAG TPA: hypothetical protein PK156_32065 [Polyangium sp.]|nr:hypothetical protein [Polyangium sp.]
MMISRKWLGVWGTLGSLVLVNCTAPTDTNPGTSGGPGGSGEGNTGNTTGQGGDTQTGSGGNTSGQGGNMPSGSGGADGGAGGDAGSTSGGGGNGTGGGGTGGDTTSGGGGSGNGSGSGGAGGNGTGGGGTGGAGTGGAGTGGGGGGPTGCTDVATLVYVLTADNDLYSFDPPARAFTRIGTINCNTTLTPNSMAIDRSGRAWVNYFDSFGQGEIWKVNVRDASCEAAPTVILPPDWAQVGMGFAVDFTRMGDDTLFIDSLSGNGLAKIDANMVVPIADFTPATFSGSVAELTGTGDGRLYGYFQTSPVYVAQINKSTAAVTNAVAITGLNTPDAYAFSFWGGSFYLYAASIGSNSRVTKYDPATGVINNNYILDTGMQIVGAGVSTCAPVQPPNN